mmetsp:Transcript_46800/g.93165  ORF Transcript_46800/g.93165 Transcript_46800/m.93165 type:complete len:119 (-) Transcript_46800:1772-2128(-)
MAHIHFWAKNSANFRVSERCTWTCECSWSTVHVQPGSSLLMRRRARLSKARPEGPDEGAKFTCSSGMFLLRLQRVKVPWTSLVEPLQILVGTEARGHRVEGLGTGSNRISRGPSNASV